MSLTPIKLPQSIPFPITISSIDCNIGDTISKHDPILKYRYQDSDSDSKKVERIGTFESPIEGEVREININLQDQIVNENRELMFIKEACNHAVQYGGLCALCGKSLEEKDYTGYDYEERAPIEMSHDKSGLKISYDEAAKIESSTTSRLSKEKKLILVVDLDQTVIHATVDPTVGEWQSDPSNPNYKAVKDVEKFVLEEDPIVPIGWSGPKLQPTKCWYYVKIRPGLKEFLSKMNELYEMHIYTMATRNYALAIAKIIDPQGTYFGDRILSRDESGSLTHKNLKRLFPVDQSMVVVIDDRGDVWQWESNLVKVVPYDFFVGIGDINSSFLPKKNGQLTGPTKRRKSIAKLEEQISPVDRMVELAGGEDNKTLLREQSLTRNQSIEQQQHDRPLAKLQHDLEQMHEKSDVQSSDDEEENLLFDDDNELTSLNKTLENIHTEFYKRFDFGEQPNLTTIIPEMKSECLKGLVILFSGIIPLGINIDSADIVIWCKQFGVRVVNEVLPEVTHVVCRDIASDVGPTFKTRVAKKLYPDIKIVNPDWLFASLSQWRKVDEKEFLINTSNPKLWSVRDAEVEKYKKVLEERLNPIDFNYNYDDFEEANQEVDDFLAGLSDEEKDEEDEEEDEEEEEEEVAESNGKSFIQSLYNKKRKIVDDDESNKKIKHDVEDLEKELLDGFDDLDHEDFESESFG